MAILYTTQTTTMTQLMQKTAFAALILALVCPSFASETAALSAAGDKVLNGAWSITYEAVDTETDKDRRADCHPTDTWWLEFRRNEELLDRKLVCSTYGIKPEIVIDRKAHPFVLTYINEGRGSGARVGFLTISVWNGVNLKEVQRLWLGESMTPFLAFAYQVGIETPRDGGLILKLDLQVQGQRDPQWPMPRFVPQRTETRISYD